MIGDDRWPDEDVLKLRALAEEGLTAGQISNSMSGYSRNAIISKLRRLGIALHGARGGPREPRVVKVREPAVQRDRAVRRSPGRPRGWDKPTAAPIVPVNRGKGITIMKLSRDKCHAVIGDARPKVGLPHYCGRPAWHDTAYCEGHYAVFHQPPRPRR
jgi:GcrA cell cycle regulator